MKNKLIRNKDSIVLLLVIIWLGVSQVAPMSREVSNVISASLMVIVLASVFFRTPPEKSSNNEKSDC